MTLWYMRGIWGDALRYEFSTFVIYDCAQDNCWYQYFIINVWEYEIYWVSMESFVVVFVKYVIEPILLSWVFYFLNTHAQGRKIASSYL